MNPSNEARWTRVLDPHTSAGSESRSAEIDVSGASYAELLIAFGEEATSEPDISIEESDTSGSGFATITTDVTAQDITATNGVNNVYFVDLRGRKKYLKVTLTIDDASVESYCCVRLSGLADGPAGSADNVGASTDFVTIV